MSDQTDPTEEAIKAEIAAAVKILREDGVHIHKTYAEFQKSLTQPPAGSADPKEGDPPPAKPKTDPTTDPPVKKGLWWGDKLNGS